ncbi:arabinose operon transcriptional regulator AraC [Chimaeribacter coloradensis]|uniref:Arabinose operon regulatory protein n=1 Tax=Chimaeribacter coloradensis TaxID=2060068 RepID=A0A2N5DU59_9GAMM|nr:arabinose operon transcriptional regulator AraC [Chimaeribacter coloradensis]PLR30309.1 arabinose operon transcriptional regulator AraC [Chimaeribacter coloradensis]
MENPGAFNFLRHSPLMKNFSFHAYLVAGFTPITTGSVLDDLINRPKGMKGYILNLTLTGKGDVETHGMREHCLPGDMLLFPPGAPHHYRRAADSDSWDHVWVYFRPRPYWIDWLDWNQPGQGVKRLRLPGAQAAAEVMALFQEILTFSDSGGHLSEALAMNALEKLILRCQQLLPAQPVPACDPRIAAICQYLNENLDQEVKIEALAQRVYLSPSRLAHLFRQELNTTILCWREAQRVSRAKSLLQISQLPIATIARMVGYEDQLYFSRLFRKHVALSPTQYRQQFDESIQVRSA